MIETYSIEWTKNRFSGRVSYDMMEPICNFYVRFTKNNKHTNRCVRVGENLITTVPDSYKRCDTTTILQNLDQCKYFIGELYKQSYHFDHKELIAHDLEYTTFYSKWLKSLRRLYARRFKNIDVYSDIKYNSTDIISQVMLWPTLFIPSNFYFNGSDFKIDIISYHITFKCYVDKCYCLLPVNSCKDYTWNNLERYLYEEIHKLNIKSTAKQIILC